MRPNHFTGLRVGTVLFGKLLKAREQVTHPTIYLSSQGVTNGGLVICEKILAQYWADAEKKRKNIDLRKNVPRQGWLAKQQRMQLLRPGGPRERPLGGGEVATVTLHVAAAVGLDVAVRPTVGLATVGVGPDP